MQKRDMEHCDQNDSPIRSNFQTGKSLLFSI